MTQAYQVVDVRTNKVVAKTNSSVEAYRVADRMDERYGRVCSRVDRDYEKMSDEEYEQMMGRVAA